MYKISNFYKKSKNMYIIRRVIGIIFYIILIPIIIINITLAFKHSVNPNEISDFLGFKSFIIVSKSMEPTIMTDDVIIVKETKKEDLKVDDIISFQDGEIINTHRIVEIINDNGETEYVTKGDNNKKEDNNRVKYDRIEGKYLFKISGLGGFVDIMRNKVTLIILLIILVLISYEQVRISKRRLERKKKRYKLKESNMKQ